jgi:hypothetical protein
MATVANPTPSRKADTTYYAIFHDKHGVLGTLDGAVLFLDSDDDRLTVVDFGDYPYIAVLGQTDIADCQQIMDRLHGGYAGLCTSRKMEVA